MRARTTVRVCVHWLLERQKIYEHVYTHQTQKKVSHCTIARNKYICIVFLLHIQRDLNYTGINSNVISTLTHSVFQNDVWRYGWELFWSIRNPLILQFKTRINQRVPFHCHPFPSQVKIATRFVCSTVNALSFLMHRRSAWNTDRTCGWADNYTPAEQQIQSAKQIGEHIELFHSGEGPKKNSNGHLHFRRCAAELT